MKEIKNMAASVRAKLLKIAKNEHSDLDKIILLYMQERLLYRISISKYAGKVLVA